MGVIPYDIGNQIYKQLVGVIGETNEPVIESLSLSVDYTDLNAGKSMDITLAKIPENCFLLHSQAYVTTVFSNGSVYAKLSVGLGTDESTSIEYPVTYPYKDLVFQSMDLDTVGENDAQGVITGDTANKQLNKFQNTLVAKFEMLGQWTVGNNLNTAREELAGAGTQTAGLSFGGYTTVVVTTTEEYDGTSWTASNGLNTARRGLAGAGTLTAGLSVAGYTTGNVATTEEYDGTSWAASNNRNTASRTLAGCGTQTAGLSFGGYEGAGGGTGQGSKTEEYDGTSWTASNDMNVTGQLLAGCGIQTVGLRIGGYMTGNIPVDTTEEYNGTTWTLSNVLSSTRYGLGGCGTQTSGLSFGGYGYSADTEEYDGNVWTTSNNMNTARAGLAGAGTQTSGLSFGGTTGSVSLVTEEYDPSYLADLTQGSLELYLTYTYI